MAVVLGDTFGNSKENNDAALLWSKSVELLKNRLDPQIYAAWIKPLSFKINSSEPSSDNDKNTFELVAPNKFYRDHIKKNYEDIIVSTLGDVIGDSQVKLAIRSPEVSAKATIVRPVSHERPAPIRPIKSEKQLSAEANLNPKYNFSNFIIGSCNQFAHAACLKVSEQPGAIYNPLFIYGGVGLGKTHLVNAIGNAVRRRGKKVLFVSSEYFVNELIHALRTNNMPEFKSRFRSLDLLIIDDIQFIMGKERTQEEFFHTFNDLYQKHKQIVVTSDKLPQELTGIEERLRTRFSCGLSADIQAPDYETRVAILSKKSESAGIDLPIDVAQYLAEQIDTNIRELEGALNRLQAMSSLNNMPITLELAQNALQLISKQTKREVTTDKIQEAVSSLYKVSPTDLLGKRRTSNIASARHVAMYLCRALTGKSYPEIGAIFGGRDHSTVIHACKTIEERLDKEEALQKEIKSIKQTFK